MPGSCPARVSGFVLQHSRDQRLVQRLVLPAARHLREAFPGKAPPPCNELPWQLIQTPRDCLR